MSGATSGGSQSNRPPPPEREYWAWVAGVLVGLLLLTGIGALLHHLGVAPVPDLFLARSPLLTAAMLTGMVFSLPLFALVLRFFFVRHVWPLHRIAEDLEALSHSPPEARLATGHEGGQAGRLAEGINDLLGGTEGPGAQVQRRLTAALASLEEEKDRLEFVLDALSEGVVVCDGNGSVAHYNRAAKRLLDRDHYLGLGRPIYPLVDKQLCDYARQKIGELTATGAPNPFVQFLHDRKGGGVLRVRVAPLTGGPSQGAGFVLTVEDPEAAAQPEKPEAAPLGGPAAGGPSARYPEPDTPLADLRYVVFDTETTGLEPGAGDEIISIGGVAIVAGKMIAKETFERLVRPGRHLSPSSIRVHGITPEMLEGQPPLAEVLPGFARFAEGAVLVAHNAAFDMRFLQNQEAATGLRFDHPVLDTLILSAVVHPSQASHALDALLSRYGIQPSGRHTALGDALMTAEVFLRLLPQLSKRGVKTLEDALRVTRGSPLSRIAF